MTYADVLAEGLATLEDWVVLVLVSWAVFAARVFLSTVRGAKF
jgi:hypothetical protein